MRGFSERTSQLKITVRGIGGGGFSLWELKLKGDALVEVREVLQ